MIAGGAGSSGSSSPLAPAASPLLPPVAGGVAAVARSPHCHVGFVPGQATAAGCNVAGWDRVIKSAVDEDFWEPPLSKELPVGVPLAARATVPTAFLHAASVLRFDPP